MKTEARTHWLKVRVSRAELLAFAGEANRWGLPVSTWARVALRGAAGLDEDEAGPPVPLEVKAAGVKR